LFAADPTLLSFDDQKFSEEVVAWQAEGFLDAELRCPAELIQTPRVPRVLSAPMSIGLFLTTACNLRCAHCFTTTNKGRARDGLPLDKIAALFAELERAGAPRLILVGGEPLLRPDIFEIVAEADEHHLDVILSTNATLITEEAARRLAASNLSKVQVSLDGPDAASHDAHRGAGTFDKACRGARRLLEAGAHHVTLRVTITRQNLERMADFATLADKLGAHSLVLKPFRQSGAALGTDDLSVDIETYRAVCERAKPQLAAASCEVKLSDGMPERMPAWTGVQPPFSCTGGTVRAVVLADGRVAACAAVPRPDDWSLHEHGLLDCWRHAPTIRAWRELAGNETCRGCEQYQRCAGGCRARALVRGGSLDDIDPWAGCD